MKNILVIFYAFFVINGCSDFKTENMDTKNDFDTNLSLYTYISTSTSDGKYLATAYTDFDIKNSIDTVFYFEIDIYKTDSVYQKNYLPIDDCNEENIDLCQFEAPLPNFDNFKHFRRYKVSEELASYFIDFTGFYGLFNANIIWVEAQQDTSLLIHYLGTKLELKVFDQKNYLK